MSSSSIITRTRSTSCTRERLENLRLLVSFIQERPRTNKEICETLGMTKSGGGKYIRELKTALVITMDQKESLNVYTITEDRALLMQFMVDINNTPRFVPTPLPLRPKESKKDLLANLEAQGRHIHVLADDACYTIKPERSRPARRDDLVAALFGPAK